MAFLKAAGVAMSRGLMFFLQSSMTFIPAIFARRIRAACTAGMVPLPGRARPTASDMQFMELAVNIPAQEPHPGQAQASSSSNWALFHSRGLPSDALEDADKINLFVFELSVIMGPPLITMEGRSPAVRP